MKDKDEWSGLVGELYEELKKLVTVSKEDKTFPSYSNKLRSHLERINNNLMESGIKILIADSHGEKGTPVKITKINPSQNNYEATSKVKLSNDIGNKIENKTEDYEDKSSDVQTNLHVITTRNIKDNQLTEDHEDQIPIREDDIGVCYACGGNEYWRSITGSRWICARCHPPINERSVVARKIV
ncbi:MAG: hypothetical protein ABFD75_07380 [Smithella sp.]